MTTPARSAGLFAALRRLLGTVLELTLVRVDLFVNELEAEKLRVFDALLRALIGLLLLGIALVLLICLVVLIVGEAYRVQAVAVLTLLFGVSGAWAIYTARDRLNSPGRLFGATRDELSRDRAALDAGE